MPGYCASTKSSFIPQIMSLQNTVLVLFVFLHLHFLQHTCIMWEELIIPRGVNSHSSLPLRLKISGSVTESSSFGAAGDYLTDVSAEYTLGQGCKLVLFS